jgi:hypothetical protein
MPSNASTLQAQGRTLTTAKNHRAPWDGVEIDLLVSCPDERAEDVAYALERTLYAVQSARHQLATGQPIGGGNEPATAASSPRQQAWTFVGNDVPPGWND